MNGTRERWLSIGLITVLTGLAYGILITQLGFYRDDWYLFSTAQSQGTAGIVALFQIDRPLVGYLYAACYRLLGTAPLAWQLTVLVVRLAGNLAFFWLLRMLWPARRAETLAIALLFSIYPGHTVEPNAAVYITDLVANAAALLSILLMLKAVRSARPAAWIAISILAGALELFYLGVFESAIGWEAARLGLLWYVFWRQTKPAFKRALVEAVRADLLYIALGIAFLVWRLFIFQSSRRATNLDVLVGKYAALPVRSALSVLVEALKDTIETIVFAWVVPFYQAVATSDYRDLAVATGLALLAAACVFVVLRLARSEQTAPKEGPASYRHRHPIWLGIFIVVFALLPINLAGRNVLFSDQWDRYTIYASAGVALAVGGFLFEFFQESARKVLLIVLIGMSVMVHYFSAAHYRDSWASERDLWQQMVWRAPALRTGTMLFVVLPSAGFVEGYEIYGPANMVYYPGRSLQLGGEVLNSATAANIQLQKNRQHYDRSVLVADNYRNTLVAVYPGQQSCLHVLDGRKVEIPGLIDDSLVADIASYSRIEMIDAAAKPAVLPTFLAGEHPRPWCLYYQRMALARQQGDWAEVARLSDEAQAKGLAPDDVSEWMPALDAFATLGRLQDMRHAASIIRSDDRARAFLCLQLQRGSAYPPPYDYNEVNQALCQAT
jgi:hypothetical protein